MNAGDLVVVRRGRRQIIGCGIVTGDYQFEPDRSYYRNTRTVEWLKKGSWQIDDSFALKTLTNITPYHKFVHKIKEIIGLEETPSIEAGMSDTPEPYEIAEALNDVFLSEGEFNHIVRTWRSKKNIILQGPPGVGKSYVAESLAFTLMGKKAPQNIRRVQFHQSYSYEDFIQGYRPNEAGYTLKDGIFTKFCKEALAQPNETFVFIIDEINRGNLSKILGELMVLIEPDKRSPKWAVSLPYNDETFYVPENMYFIGMMNTADRSLSMVDYALRRRFAFIDILPQFTSPKFRTFLSSKGASERFIDKLISKVSRLNEEIMRDEAGLGEGFCIGHSYFCPSSKASAIDEGWYRAQVETEILPLLKEYWFDDKQKVADMRELLLTDMD